MTRELYRNIILTLIAGLLFILALRPTASVKAQEARGNWYVEPRSVLVPSEDGATKVSGKLMINLNTGDIWGFPTKSVLPYAVDPLGKTPPVVKPVYLGRFDLAAAQR
jgi:hypothetical protein